MTSLSLGSVLWEVAKSDIAGGRLAGDGILFRDAFSIPLLTFLDVNAESLTSDCPDLTSVARYSMIMLQPHSSIVGMAKGVTDGTEQEVLWGF